MMAASVQLPRRADEYVPGRPSTLAEIIPLTVKTPKATIVNTYNFGEHRVFSECPVCGSYILEGLGTEAGITQEQYRQHHADEHNPNSSTKRRSVMAKGSTTKTDEIRAQREAAAASREGGKAEGTNGTTKPAAKQKAELAPIVQKDLIAAVGEYVNSAGSSEPDAPQNGAPFVQKGKVYMQLAGRGGVGKGTDVEQATGLLPHLAAQGSTMAASKRQLQGALSDLGFNRSPFAYVHPERGSTAASYYSADVGVLKGVKLTVAERVGKREVAKAEKEAAAAAAPAPEAASAA